MLSHKIRQFHCTYVDKDGCLGQHNTHISANLLFFCAVSFLQNLVCILLQARTDHCDPTQKWGGVSREPASLGCASGPATSVICSFVIHSIVAIKLFHSLWKVLCLLQWKKKFLAKSYVARSSWSEVYNGKVTILLPVLGDWLFNFCPQ